jgi:hypothetical protein
MSPRGTPTANVTLYSGTKVAGLGPFSCELVIFLYHLVQLGSIPGGKKYLLRCSRRR